MNDETNIESPAEDTSPRPSPQGGEGESQAVAGVDQAGLKASRKEVENTAKSLGKAAQAAANAAEQLSLAAIGDEPEFEESMLLTSDEIKKKYTGENARQIQWRRDAAVYMLARQCPVEDIMKILHMNWRTVTAIAAAQGQQLAGFSEAYAKELMSGAGAAFALARTKMNEASFLQLATGAGIMVDKAIAIKGGIPTGGEDTPIDVSEEDPALKSAREFLQKNLKSANPVKDTKE